MVSSVRNSICKTFTDTELNEQRKVQRGGKTYILNTANIGSKSITKASELKENDIVIVSSDHPPLSDGVISGGMSGRVIFIPNPKNALVELAQGGCALLLTKYLNSNQPQQHLASSGADKQGERAVSTASACDKGASSLNLNDLISSLNALSDAELEKVGRAISQLQPHQVKIIMHSLAQSKELSVASLEAIASVHPDVVHQAIAVDCSKIM